MTKVDLTGAIFSFSKLNTYKTCPYSWYDIYINKADRIHNAFSQYGTLVHSILERYALGKTGVGEDISTWELTSILNEEYEAAVTEKFPKNAYCELSERYHDAAVKFFQEIDDSELISGIESKRYEILGVEYDFIFDIVVDEITYKCRGFIDLVLRDTTDGKIIIVDHKSKSIKKNAKGIPVEKDIKEAFLQMSMYAIPIFNNFGEYPKEIWIDAFKIQDIFKREFKPEMAEVSLEWAREIIKLIDQDREFKKVPDSFFCTQLCSCRLTCGKFIKFDKNGFMYDGQPTSAAEKIARDKMLDNIMNGADEEEVVKPFSWDDDEEFEV